MRARGDPDRRGSGRGSRSTPPHLPAHTEAIVVVPVVGVIPVAVGYVVQGIQVDIGKKLGSLIAQRQAFAALMRGKQVVPGEIKGHRLLLVRVVDDFAGQRRRAGAFGREIGDAPDQRVRGMILIANILSVNNKS